LGSREKSLCICVLWVMLSHCLFSLFKNSYAGNFCTGLKPTADMFKRSRSEDSPMSHPLQYIHPPYFHDRHPEPCILRSFSPPLKSFAPFRVIDVGFIKALLWRITSCRSQLIIQEVDLGTTLPVLWSLHASMASFSLPATGLHHWPSIERFCMVFNAKSLFHTMWIVLQYLEGHHHYRWFLSCLLTAYIVGW